MFSKLNNWLSAYLKTSTWWCNFQLPVGEHSAWQPCKARRLQLQVLARASEPTFPARVGTTSPFSPTACMLYELWFKQPIKPSCTQRWGREGKKCRYLGQGQAHLPDNPGLHPTAVYTYLVCGRCGQKGHRALQHLLPPPLPRPAGSTQHLPIPPQAPGSSSQEAWPTTLPLARWGTACGTQLKEVVLHQTSACRSYQPIMDGLLSASSKTHSENHHSGCGKEKPAAGAQTFPLARS